MKEVLKAAYSQRMDSTLVAIGHQQQGSSHPQSNTVQLSEQEQTIDRTLMDFARIYTLLKGKNVLAVEQGQVQSKSPVVVTTAIDCSAARPVGIVYEQII